ncbi:hypothetical protein AVEN_72874-1 [Araneus ventricosus]|uniref:Uncharacterized protein n=1 Tax=Araneus ventricosus TaxID=182803 RepID=A0A4Y2LQH7_ARAVE|nr:hypothetical protein AVEN_72874-1 [Araneus ventricosus]
MAVGDGSPGGIIDFWWSSGDTPCHGWVKGILVAPRQSALLGQPRVQVCASSPQQISMTISSFLLIVTLTFAFQPETFLQKISSSLSFSKSPKKVLLSSPCISHFESPGEDRQTAKFFKRAKAQLEFNFSSQGKPTSPSGISVVKASKDYPTFYPIRTRLPLSLTKERVSSLIGKKGFLENLVFATCHNGQEEGVFWSSGEDFAGQPRPHNKETDLLVRTRALKGGGRKDAAVLFLQLHAGVLYTTRN